MGYLSSLADYLIISAPYLILGLAVSGLIKAFIDAEKLSGWLGQGKLRDVFLAAVVGVPLPLCSCSVIPTAVTLRKNGASNGATSAFLIATPESGIDSIAMTYAMMDLPMTLIRPIAAFLSAMLAGVLQMFFNDFEVAKEDAETEKKSCCSGTKHKPSIFENIKTGMKYAFGKLINDLSLWMTIGILLGALISYLVPENYFLTLGRGESTLMILVIGIPLYICASATTPIAASLILKGLNPGAALILLLVGPATNISNMAVIQKYIGKKGLILNIISIVVVALFFGELTNYIYFDLLKIDPKSAMNLTSIHEHDQGYSILSIASAGFISMLLLKGIYLEEIKPRFFQKAAHCH